METAFTKPSVLRVA